MVGADNKRLNEKKEKLALQKIHAALQSNLENKSIERFLPVIEHFMENKLRKESMFSCDMHGNYSVHH